MNLRLQRLIPIRITKGKNDTHGIGDIQLEFHQKIRQQSFVFLKSLRFLENSIQDGFILAGLNVVCKPLFRKLRTFAGLLSCQHLLHKIKNI